MDLSLPFSVSERFAATLEGLYRAVAARFVRGGLAEGLILLICGRVRSVERRVLGLLARFRAGRVLVRVSRSGAATRSGLRVCGARLPRGFGWLLPLVPTHAAGFASQLRVVLAEEEMQALLAACPQARRVLGPVCRMLAIEASVLRPGVVEVVAVPEGTARVRAPRATVDWGRVPLPRGVMAAAKRAGVWRKPGS